MRYYLLYRPPSIGTHPKGAVNVVAFDKREKIKPGVWAWGYVEYDRKLSEEEIRNYELLEEQ